MIPYYILPPSQLAGLDRVLEEAAIRYKKELGEVPVLFLDGIDLAKYDKQLCTHLITHTKIMANEGTLRIVLITNKGMIMPLLEVLSAMNRALLYEIGDVTDEKALEFLMENDIEENVARELVKYVGGRIIHLELCVVSYRY